MESQVESQHGSSRLRKEHKGYWGVRAEITGAWLKERAGETGRDASKRHREDKVKMMALSYESAEE